MYPELLTVGNVSVGSFGVMVALAFLTAYLLTERELKRKNINPNIAQDLLLWIVVCSLLGAKLFFMAQNPDAPIFSGHGFTFYGGFFGGLAAGIAVARVKGIGIWKMLDAAAPGLALAYAIGRIGCLLVGDDYGTASSLPWAMAFPNGLPPVDFTVHPTQIYETAAMTAVFAALWKLRLKITVNGSLFALYLMLAGLERFAVEFVRTTTPSPVPGLSVAQVIALGLISFGAVKLIKARK
ncbi:MAG: prolipoprotein diacylglyceryl transferase [Candidatus Mycalebacterium zealandia]|nr:MAG: prolipoprotein diacylglyceryl transferase [Candidatus Mycalebacterium zealandia]